MFIQQNTWQQCVMGTCQIDANIIGPMQNQLQHYNEDKSNSKKLDLQFLQSQGLIQIYKITHVIHSLWCYPWECWQFFHGVEMTIVIFDKISSHNLSLTLRIINYLESQNVPTSK